VRRWQVAHGLHPDGYWGNTCREARARPPPHTHTPRRNACIDPSRAHAHALPTPLAPAPPLI
jgi:hypothetical protein